MPGRSMVTVGGAASAMVLAACGLGVVDIPPDPAPAELLVISEIRADPADPSQVRVVVRATLDPGITPEGVPRRVTRDVLRVEGTDHSPSPSGDPSRPTWVVTELYPTPGPEAVRLGLPKLEDFGLAETINMRIRVDMTPGNTILLGDGDDLVITAEPPSNPAQDLEWSLELTSTAMPEYQVQMGGKRSWPAEMRVPAEQIPASALPLTAALRIRWDRSLELFELTPEARYVLRLRSIILVDWTVEAAS